MRTWMVTLALASHLLASSATAGEAARMSLAEFRLRSDAARTYMVTGALALVGKLDVACPRAIAVGEWTAGLMFAHVDPQQPWIDVFMDLLSERGCGSVPVQADT